MVIVSCDSSLLCYLYFPLLKFFCVCVSDFFRLVNIFLDELDMELIFVNGLASVGTFKFL